MPRLRRVLSVRICAVRLLSVLLLSGPAVAGAEEGVLARLDALPPAQFFAPGFIREVYVRAADHTLWNGPRLAQLRALIDAAAGHGLTPADYLHAELAALTHIDELRGAARLDADLTATEAFLRYGYHVQYGKVDPLELDAAWNYDRAVEIADPAAVVVSLVHSAELAKAVAPLMRHGPLYSRLRQWLATYRAIAAQGPWLAVRAGPALRPGDHDSRVAEVRARLAREGFGSTAAEPAVFDAALEAQVKAWQLRHGLDADGIVGTKTVAAMAIPPDALVDRLRVNLERLRWAAPERQERALLVNIAGFTLQLREEGRIRWSTRVVVGKPYRQTPVFRATMTYLVFNPDWTIPPTILSRDTLPAIRKDPDYLAKQHMDVVTASGRPVNPEAIDWQDTGGKRFPWFIRQRPGPWNALGQVKFIFPNEHFVFLHDTPSRELFARTERGFSSGCIRVAQPLELAAILLEDQAGYSPAEIGALLATGDTRTVFLQEPLPVLLQYLTAVEMEAGQFRFHRDLYERDDAVLAALDAPPPTR